MSIDLVTLEQVYTHCRLDDNAAAEDQLLGTYIRAASRAVLTYLKDAAFLDSSGDVIEDSSGALDVPEDVQVATLLLIGEWYKNREAEQSGEVGSQYGYGFLPRPVLSLLYPYRAPTIA